MGNKSLSTWLLWINMGLEKTIETHLTFCKGRALIHAIVYIELYFKAILWDKSNIDIMIHSANENTAYMFFRISTTK